jgi:hypothetical protein
MPAGPQWLLVDNRQTVPGPSMGADGTATTVKESDTGTDGQKLQPVTTAVYTYTPGAKPVPTVMQVSVDVKPLGPVQAQVKGGAPVPESTLAQNVTAASPKQMVLFIGVT